MFPHRQVIAWIASFFFRLKEAERKTFIIMSSQVRSCEISYFLLLSVTFLRHRH